jgi:hypothetical protein
MSESPILDLLATGYWRKTVRRDYLVKGLYSALLAPPTAELTWTMMVVPPHSPGVLPEDLLSPHNHAYDFTAWVFSGEIIDRSYHEVYFDEAMASTEPVSKFFKVIYDMRAGGGVGDTQICGEALLGVRSETRLAAGGEFSMSRHDIHDVIVEDQPVPTIWVRRETDRIPAATVLYNKRDIGASIGAQSSQIDSAEIEPWLTAAGLVPR